MMDTIPQKPAVAAPEGSLPEGHPTSSPTVDTTKLSIPSPDPSIIDHQSRPPPQQHSHSDQQPHYGFPGGYSDPSQPQRAHSIYLSAFHVPSHQHPQQTGYSGHPTTYTQAPPHYPNSQHRHPHTRYQTGASPAAVAYQLSQHTQQQYQGGVAPGTANVPGIVETAGQVHYGINVGVTVGYQQSSGTAVVGYDQYGRTCTVTTQASDSAMITSAHQHPQAYAQVPYAIGYPQQFMPPQGQPGMWYGPGPQYLAPHGGYGPIQAVNVPGVYGVPEPMQHPYGPPVENQELHRRHSVPVRQSQRPTSYGSNLNPSVHPPAGPRQGTHSMRRSPSLNTSRGNTTASSSRTTPSGLPRGPPRKPKQSGHAIWVGNLPVGATVTAVKDHFSENLKHEIQSVKMMSKTDCAFINYKTEEAATEALRLFNESRFQGKKLVVRPRREPSSGSQKTIGKTGDLDAKDYPTPADPKEQEQINDSADGSGTSSGVSVPSTTSTVQSPPVGPAGARPKPNAKDRYFIIKSLTLEDLESSLRTGVWATQSENEPKLNQAYEAAENVYLIFSANRSGEYFGYARMTSGINPDPADATSSHPPAALQLPAPAIDRGSETLTPETKSAPAGRIVDDRDTLFWEVLTEPSDSRPCSPGPEVVPETLDGVGKIVEAKGGNGRGYPFRITWISTTKVPFHQTRGLRNQLNSNREIKIARDGTEVDEAAGRKLVALFKRGGWNSGSGAGR